MISGIQTLSVILSILYVSLPLKFNTLDYNTSCAARARVTWPAPWPTGLVSRVAGLLRGYPRTCTRGPKPRPTKQDQPTGHPRPAGYHPPQLGPQGGKPTSDPRDSQQVNQQQLQRVAHYCYAHQKKMKSCCCFVATNHERLFVYFRAFVSYQIFRY